MLTVTTTIITTTITTTTTMTIPSKESKVRHSHCICIPLTSRPYHSLPFTLFTGLSNYMHRTFVYPEESNWDAYPTRIDLEYMSNRGRGADKVITWEELTEFQNIPGSRDGKVCCDSVFFFLRSNTYSHSLTLILYLCL